MEEALKRVLADVTGLVVAHRASTVMLADRVAVLSHGTIVAVGTHAELLATSQEYRDLMSADFDAEAELDVRPGSSSIEPTSGVTAMEVAR